MAEAVVAASTPDSDHRTPAEQAISNAMLVVEKSGAHPLLTDAVVLLSQAREKIAEWDARVLL